MVKIEEIKDNVDIYKEWSQYKDALDALTRIQPVDKVVLVQELKNSREFQIPLINSKEFKVSDLIRGALYYAGHNKPEYLRFLLIAGIGNHREFEKANPLQYAVTSGHGNIVTMLRTNPTFYDSLKAANNLGVGGDDAFTKLYTAIITDDPTILKNLSSSEKAELLEGKDFKVRPVQFAMKWGSMEVVGCLLDEYGKELPKKLLKCFEKGLKDQPKLDKHLKDTMKEEVINLLYDICPTEQMKKEGRTIAGAMVRDAADIAGVTRDWGQAFSHIKDIMKKCLAKLGFFNSNLKKVVALNMEYLELIPDLKALNAKHQIKSDSNQDNASTHAPRPKNVSQKRLSSEWKR